MCSDVGFNICFLYRANCTSSHQCHIVRATQDHAVQKRTFEFMEDPYSDIMTVIFSEGNTALQRDKALRTEYCKF